jgi:hypothetical protein
LTVLAGETKDKKITYEALLEGGFHVVVTGEDAVIVNKCADVLRNRKYHRWCDC